MIRLCLHRGVARNNIHGYNISLSLRLNGGSPRIPISLLASETEVPIKHRLNEGRWHNNEAEVNYRPRSAIIA